jgi:Clostridium epsilon toxin ETX/Bacillus mosquitocidal toxin MTX2
MHNLIHLSFTQKILGSGVFKRHVLFFMSAFTLIFNTSIEASYISDFKDVVREWADETARQHNTRVLWVDISAGKDHIRDHYPAKKITMKHRKTKFKKPEILKESETTVFRDTSINRFPESQSFTIREKIEHSDSFTWEIQEGIKLGSKVTIESGIKGIAKGEIEVNGAINFGSTQGKTFTSTNEHEISRTFNIPARSHVEIEAIIRKANYKVDFTSLIEIKGQAAVWFEKKIDIDNGNDRHWLWFPTPERILIDHPSRNYQIDGNGKVVYKAKGVLRGKSGFDISVKTKRLRKELNSVTTEDERSSLKRNRDDDSDDRKHRKRKRK